MNILVAVILLIHAVPHLVGFAGPWRLAQQLPYKTTILAGRVDVGDTGIKVIGLLWLAVAIVFGGAAVGALFRAAWWPSLTLAVAGVSLVLCVLGWPDARFGLPINVGIFVLLLVGMGAGWWRSPG
ncbi:MAG: hypothetical protein K6T75_09760 [Acetobacteraceae bacterium]|nr:hypothetical protein [Acetobacteraceae bacterium]